MRAAERWGFNQSTDKRCRGSEQGSAMGDASSLRKRVFSGVLQNNVVGERTASAEEFPARRFVQHGHVLCETNTPRDSGGPAATL